MHGTSHHMGLDTHDYGALKTPMKAAMLFTVEPVIYIPEENIGIRIEDDVVVTADGYRNLSEALPRHPDEVEKWMRSLRY